MGQVRGFNAKDSINAQLLRENSISAYWVSLPFSSSFLVCCRDTKKGGDGYGKRVVQLRKR